LSFFSVVFTLPKKSFFQFYLTC